MAVIISKKATEFEMPPPGNHVAVCFGVAELGTHKTEFGFKPKMRLFFELSNELMDSGKPFVISEACNISLGRNKQGKPGRLLELLESWRGRKFTDDELKAFDVAKLLGVPCMINVVHQEFGDKLYANIANIAPLAKGIPKPALINKAFEYSIAEHGSNFPDGMFEWVINKVKESPEYQSLASVRDAGGDPDYETSGVDDGQGADTVPF